VKGRFFRHLVGLFVLPLFFFGVAQERHNSLGINGVLWDEAGPYYFISHGDSRNAYAKAVLLAEALGLILDFDDTSKDLTFRQGATTATLKTTPDIAKGLSKHLDSFTVNGKYIESPMGIIINGLAYVAITPIVSAFGGESDWLPADNLITIVTGNQLPTMIAKPRIGSPNGLITRVAIDIPTGQNTNFAVGNGVMVISFSDARSDSFTLNTSDTNVSKLSFEQLGSDLILIVQPRHDISPSGTGYEFGKVAHPNHEVLFIDFAPNLQGDAVDVLSTEPGPADGAATGRIVVIDAGHGGHDPGASSDFAVEEEVVLNIALGIEERLKEEGIQAVLTRDSDIFLTLKERSSFATPNHNLFISIHANSALNANAEGIETWVFGQPLDPGLISQAIRENGGGAAGEALTQEALANANGIAGDILKEAQLNYSLTLAEVVQDRMIRATGAKNRGVKQNVFYVISTARIPAILVEVGFLNNAQEGPKLKTYSYQRTLASALAEGIVEFLDNGGTGVGR
jgi:N-acetylmuramoyl-L-alanine amidase